jgi:spermidine synthase
MLLVPTLLMGATLPILTAWLVQREPNVGRSVGLLYFVNTCGSAVACFVAGLWMMGALGMQGAVICAAAINFMVAGGAFCTHLATAPRKVAVPSGPAPVELKAAEASAGSMRARFMTSLAMAAGTGLLALSAEIAWFRVMSVGSRGSAAAFALTLGAFLGGIAIGSLAGRRFCDRPPGVGRRHLNALAGFLLASTVVGFLLIPLAAEAATHGFGIFALAMLALVGVHGLLSGAMFPLISHHGIAPDGESGSRLSFVYMLNIAGSAAGSIGTGFFLVDHLDIRQLAVVIALMGATLAVVLGLLALRNQRGFVPLVTCAAAIAVAAPQISPLLYDGIYEKLILSWQHGQPHGKFEIIENKSGVIAVEDHMIVYGGGAYDGRVSVDLVDDVNRLVRPAALSLFHPAPRRVLMIGMATGAWTSVLANHPAVESVTVIEINRGYLELMRRYPVVAGVLSNPKVDIQIDDARRWLNRHPDERYDVVISNTTLHWRGNTTNLLSQEFNDLAVRHLKPGGIFMSNATGSLRAWRTACVKYPNSLRFTSMSVISRNPIELDAQRYAESLRAFVIDGRPAFDLSQERDSKQLSSLVAQAGVLGDSGTALEPCASVVARSGGMKLITDDNMGEEWVNQDVIHDSIISRIRSWLGLKLP